MTRKEFSNAIILVIFIVILKLAVSDSKPLNDYFDLDKDGYYFTYKTPDNQKRSETGTIKTDNKISISGTYYYSQPDEVSVAVAYDADERGYRPSVWIKIGKAKGELDDIYPILQTAQLTLQGGGIG